MVGVSPLSCPFEIDNDLKAMFASAEAIGFGRLNIDVIDAGAKHYPTSLPDQIIAFANRDFGFAFAVSLEKKAHFPASNPLPLDERVRRYIEVLNSYSISTPASEPAPISFSGAYIRGSGHEHCSYCCP
jgi:hypothetical protein